MEHRLRRKGFENTILCIAVVKLFCTVYPRICFINNQRYFVHNIAQRTPDLNLHELNYCAVHEEQLALGVLHHWDQMPRVGTKLVSEHIETRNI